MKGETILNSKNKNGFGIFWAIVTSVITIMSLTLAIFVVLDKKKKKEDHELEEYLEASIN